MQHHGDRRGSQRPPQNALRPLDGVRPLPVRRTAMTLRASPPTSARAICPPSAAAYAPAIARRPAFDHARPVGKVTTRCTRSASQRSSTSQPIVHTASDDAHCRSAASTANAAAASNALARRPHRARPSVASEAATSIHAMIPRSTATRPPPHTPASPPIQPTPSPAATAAGRISTGSRCGRRPLRGCVAAANSTSLEQLCDRRGREPRFGDEPTRPHVSMSLASLRRATRRAPLAGRPRPRARCGDRRTRRGPEAARRASTASGRFDARSLRAPPRRRPASPVTTYPAALEVASRATARNGCMVVDDQHPLRHLRNPRTRESATDQGFPWNRRDLGANPLPRRGKIESRGHRLHRSARDSTQRAFPGRRRRGFADRRRIGRLASCWRRVIRRTDATTRGVAATLRLSRPPGNAGRRLRTRSGSRPADARPPVRDRPLVRIDLARRFKQRHTSSSAGGRRS